MPSYIHKRWCNFRTLIDSKDRIDVGDYGELALKIQNISVNKSLLLERAIRNFNVVKLFEYEKLNEKRNRFYQSIFEDL